MFSEKFLRTRLPRQPEWDDDALPPFKSIRTVWQRAHQFGDAWDDTRTREESIQPVLEILGWALAPQDGHPDSGQSSPPDYALFAPTPVQHSTGLTPNQPGDSYRHPLAVADGVSWEAPLGRDQNGAQGNPGQQIVAQILNTNLPWGILTNGRIWRLYSQQVSSIANQFYQIDLNHIYAPDQAPAVASGSRSKLSDQLPPIDLFKHFWLLFRSAAFVPDAQGATFAARFSRSYRDYAREVGQNSVDLAINHVIPELASGFTNYRAHELGITEESEESLQQVYQACCRLFLQLVYLLYAETHALLPVTDQSLSALVQWATHDLDRNVPISTATHSTPKYDSLLDLLHRVNQETPGLGLPHAGGGLFGPEHPDGQFLETHKLSNQVLASALDTLAGGSGETTDFAALPPHQLGTLYQNFLKHRLQFKESVERPGEIDMYLVLLEGQRQSGLFTDPADDIVDYAVRRVLTPVLDERTTQFGQAMDRCAGLRETGQANGSAVDGQIQAAESEVLRAFLGIRVVDPTLRTGRFLLSAVDCLTDGIIQRLQSYHDHHPQARRDWNPIHHLIAQENDGDGPDDTMMLTRLVTQHCVFGVAADPMVIELTRLSLLLHTGTTDAPVRCLDQHLRRGDPLLGIDARRLEQATRLTVSEKVDEYGQVEQRGLFASPFAGWMDLPGLLAELPRAADDSLTGGDQCPDVLDRLRIAAAPFRQVLDLWTSHHFGNPNALDFLLSYGRDVLPAVLGQIEAEPRYQKALQQARDLARSKAFFHWDLEFPEIFIDLDGQDWASPAGFDVVIGNPPGGSILDETTRNVLESQFTAASASDGYSTYFERGIQVLKPGGSLAFLAPAAWQTDHAHRDFREYVLKCCRILEIVDLDHEVFPILQPGTAVHIIQKVSEYDPANTMQTGTVVTASGRQPPDSGETLAGLEYDQLDAEQWVDDPQHRFLTNRDVLTTMMKMSSPSTIPLDEISTSARGVLVKPTDLENQQFDPDYKPFFDGRLYRYDLDWLPGTFVNYGPNLHEIPADYRYFSGPRLLVRRVLSRRLGLMSTFVEQEFVNKKDIYNIVLTDNRYSQLAILGILNSCLVSFFCITDSKSATKIEFPQLRLADLRRIPIPKIELRTQHQERQSYAQERQRHYQHFCTGGAPDQLLELVRARLAAGQEDIVHDLLGYLSQQMITMHRDKRERQAAFCEDLSRHLTQGQMNRLNRLYTPLKAPAPQAEDYRLRMAAHEQATADAHAQLGSLAGEKLALEDVWQLNTQQWVWVLEKRVKNADRITKSAAVFDEYRHQLASLMNRIQRTDWLIDQLVYQLYGLTEEEIALVAETLSHRDFAP